MPIKFKPNYIAIPVIVLLVSLIGSLVTNMGMGWYNELNFPALVPPGYIIGLIWTGIFVLCAIAAMVFYNSSDRSPYSIIISLLMFNNAFLNIFWSMLFFGQHNIGAALIEILILNATNLAIILLLQKKHRTAALLWLPYFIWVCFATYLNYSIWVLN